MNNINLPGGVVITAQVFITQKSVSRVLDSSSGTLKDVKTLLYFGVDWVSFNIAQKEGEEASKAIKFLSSLFKIKHNDTNSSEHLYPWGDTGDEVLIKFTGKSTQGEVLYVDGEKGKSLIRVTKIFNHIKKNLNIEYSYRIDCYGTLFDYNRIEILDIKDYLSFFFDDLKNNRIVHSVTRLDINADIAKSTVTTIERSVSNNKKKKTRLNIDPNTNEPETVNFGNKKDTWMARIYNKLLDAIAKGKQWVFIRLGYFKHKTVTRTELELHDEKCRFYKVQLEDIFNTKKIFEIYKDVLNKQADWGITRFIEKELQKSGYSFGKPEKRQHIAEALGRFKHFSRTVNMVRKLIEQYGYSPWEIWKEVCKKIGVNPEEKNSLSQEEFVRIISS